MAEVYGWMSFEGLTDSETVVDPADLWSVFDAFAHVSRHFSVVQQVHDIVEVAAEARLRHDTGVLAKDPSVLFGASACGRKVGVAEVLESCDHTALAEMLLRQEALKLHQSCKYQSELLLNTIKGCVRRELTDEASLQLGPKAGVANLART